MLLKLTLLLYNGYNMLAKSLDILIKSSNSNLKNKRLPTFIFLVCCSNIFTSSFAQTGDSFKNKTAKLISVDLSAIQTHLLSNHFYGFNFDFKYFPIKQIGTGLNFTYAQKKITDTFTYSIKKPIIAYYEVGWITQYNFLETDKVRMNVNLNNGISISRLGGDAIQEKHRGRFGYIYRSKEVATNYYYLLEPGADFSCKLLSFNRSPDVWITAKAKYRFPFGNSKYAATRQFSDYLFGLGISLIGNVF